MFSMSGVRVTFLVPREARRRQDQIAKALRLMRLAPKPKFMGRARKLVPRSIQTATSPHSFSPIRLSLTLFLDVYKVSTERGWNGGVLCFETDYNASAREDHEPCDVWESSGEELERD